MRLYLIPVLIIFAILFVFWLIRKFLWKDERVILSRVYPPSGRSDRVYPTYETDTTRSQPRARRNSDNYIPPIVSVTEKLNREND